MKVNYKKSYLLLFLGCGLVFIAFAWFFALERILSADTATYLFNLVNNKTFNFGSQRFIASFTQILPLLFIYFKAPLVWVVKIYSLNFVVYHLIILTLISLVLKDNKTSLVFLFTHLIAGSLLIYYPVSEYQMGISWSLLLYSYVQRFQLFENFQFKHLFFPILSLFVILYSHPLSFIVVGFFMGYLLLEKEILKLKTIAIAIGIIGAIWFSKYFLFSVPNDTNNLDLIQGLKLFPEVAWNIFWPYTIKYDFIFVAFFLINLVVLIARKKYKLLAFYSLFFLVHLHMCLSKLGPSEFNWYSSHVYQALYLGSSLVFVEQVWAFITNEKIKFLLASSILCISFFTCYLHKNYNQDRIDYIEGLIQSAESKGLQKAIILKNNTKPVYREWLWALDIESLILSTCKEELPSTTIVVRKEGEVSAEELQLTNSFMITWTSLPIEEVFDPNYFELKEGSYHYLRK